jgi:tRNA (guanine-N7-)-methyltransferase
MSESEDGAPPAHRRSGVLHGRQQGRRLRPGQQTLLDTLLPTLALDLSRPLDPAALFPEPPRELRLEIGFGGGEHLVGQALRHPEIGFIGCEPFRNGVASLIHHVHEAGAKNIRVHAGDAGEVIDRVPDGAQARVDLLYPDPGPKRRQRKRRFVSTAMLARLGRVLRPGGLFRFATDIDDYAGWTLARILASAEFDWPAGSAADWRVPPPDWIRTRYEAKAEREGRRPVYLSFVRR